MEGLNSNGRIISKWIFKKFDVKIITGLKCLKIRSNGGFCEHCKESSDLLKAKNFLIRHVTTDFQG
jgi:hypothetical protein